jgi:hypothetical protein
MARVAKASKSTKSITPPREPGRSLTVTGTKPAKTGKPTLSTRSRAAAPIEKRKPGRPAKGSIVAPTISTRATKTALRAPARPLAPKASKEELRVQVEKMEQLVTTLRAKSREANKAAKEATARISELEQQVAQLEKKIASASAPARQPGPPKPAQNARATRLIQVTPFRLAWPSRILRLSTKRRKLRLRSWKSISARGNLRIMRARELDVVSKSRSASQLVKEDGSRGTAP